MSFWNEKLSLGKYKYKKCLLNYTLFFNSNLFHHRSMSSFGYSILIIKKTIWNIVAQSLEVNSFETFF